MTRNRKPIDDNLRLWRRINEIAEKASVRFLWFVAGAVAGYLWMARAYGLF
jgi:hypothetical protein